MVLSLEKDTCYTEKGIFILNGVVLVNFDVDSNVR